MRENFNSEIVTLRLTRLQVCDLLLSCLAARDCCSDEGKKWMILHDKIKDRLDEHDFIMDALDNRKE